MPGTGIVSPLGVNREPGPAFSDTHHPSRTGAWRFAGVYNYSLITRGRERRRPWRRRKKNIYICRHIHIYICKGKGVERMEGEGSRKREKEREKEERKRGHVTRHNTNETDGAGPWEALTAG